MERLGDDPQAVIINRLFARFLLCNSSFHIHSSVLCMLNVEYGMCFVLCI